MRTLLRLRRNDTGAATIIAMAVVALVALLSAAVFASTTAANDASGRLRQRSVAVGAAESGIDYAFSQIGVAGTAPTLKLPCSDTATGWKPITGGGDKVEYRVDIKYYGVYPVPDPPTELTCSAGELSATPKAALITSFGRAATDTTATRIVQTLVKLNPVYDDGTDKAIFANGTVTLANKGTVTGNVGNDADVYTNKSIICNNNQSYGGDIFAQGDVSFASTCTAAGGIHAKGYVRTTNNSSIGGDVISSRSYVSLSGQTSVVGRLRAASSVSWNGCSAPNKCYPNQTGIPDPPAYNFPQIKSDAATLAAWEAEGYLRPTTAAYSAAMSNCGNAGGGLNGPTKWLVDNAATLASDTMIVTSCEVRLQNTKTTKFKNDIVIFAKGGFVTSNQVQFDSVDSVNKRVYIIIPYDVATAPCSTPQLSTDNLFKITEKIEMMLYSPCNITFSNQATQIGQIYGGSDVTINNQFNMQYRPMPVYGLAASVSGAVQKYKVDIVYKRESNR